MSTYALTMSWGAFAMSWGTFTVSIHIYFYHVIENL
jgi:hypothetical protein